MMQYVTRTASVSRSLVLPALAGIAVLLSAAGVLPPGAPLISSAVAGDSCLHEGTADYRGDIFTYTYENSCGYDLTLKVTMQAAGASPHESSLYAKKCGGRDSLQYFSTYKVTSLKFVKSGPPYNCSTGKRMTDEETDPDQSGPVPAPNTSTPETTPNGHPRYYRGVDLKDPNNNLLQGCLTKCGDFDAAIIDKAWAQCKLPGVAKTLPGLDNRFASESTCVDERVAKRQSEMDACSASCETNWYIQ